MREAAPMQSTAVPQPRAQPRLGIAAESLAPQRPKRAESAAAADAAAPLKDAREVELERIARLRTEGHHADADKALEAFRRAHPDYRIAEAMWERVRPR
jgi:soluble lytic murein transglycosylase-like protein